MYPSLQRSYFVKDVRKRLNAEVDVVRVENGAYRPFKKTLLAFLTHIVSTFAYDKLLPIHFMYTHALIYH